MATSLQDQIAPPAVRLPRPLPPGEGFTPAERSVHYTDKRQLKLQSKMASLPSLGVSIHVPSCQSLEVGPPRAHPSPSLDGSPTQGKTLVPFKLRGTMATLPPLGDTANTPDRKRSCLIDVSTAASVERPESTRRRCRPVQVPPCEASLTAQLPRSPVGESRPPHRLWKSLQGASVPTTRYLLEPATLCPQSAT